MTFFSSLIVSAFLMGIGTGIGGGGICVIICGISEVSKLCICEARVIYAPAALCRPDAI